MTTTLATAYILQIHNNPDQVNKFITQLLTGNQADIYVHIDRKSYDKLKGKIIIHPNVTVLSTSINCEWGDISQVDTTLLLLNEVVASKKMYDYVCLRSGQDLLVKDGFKDFLITNSGKAFMTYKRMNRSNLGHVKLKWPKITRRRYTTAHPIRIFRRILQSLYRKGINLSPNLNDWPKDYQFYKGSQWFSIPFDLAKYVIEFVEENEWYYKFFEHTLVPDESFFHTLILNSSYREAVVNNNLYFWKWGETLSDKNSPQYLSSGDIEQIVGSNQYFARKFDETIDQSVVHYFYERIGFGQKITNTG
ncbi:hypothetical protein J2Z40_002431 [Cytobacillus eiseniae]|uniref:Peptide O-xylosyltransferase n=1 Tax=Cytobacillus eiseniae TaxID=762947 RepID=A0ABS4RG36_9BACI|nr:beta-1,6-N-acetylglucosaminyltransferase [Cytobacillus eiseniae]MBP2241858.1 hypothetical protein [Cytobacillus eiseniae]